MRTAINPITARMVQIIFGHLLLFGLQTPYPTRRGFTHPSPVSDDVGMAEGDTVFATASRMHEALAGHELTRTDLRVPRFATVDLSGQVVREVAPRGKHLLVRTDGDVSIHSHLGMDGAWRLYEPGERWRGRAFEVRCVLETEHRIAVGHRLRKLEVIRTSAERRLLAHLGPDVLGPDWDAAEATRRLTARSEREIGNALVDQSVMAGPGNVYRSEVCFLAGVDPRTEVGQLEDPAGLVEITKSLMERNRGGGRRVTTDDPRASHDLWVYGRRGRPCRRCGTPIRSFMQGDAGEARVVYVCPACQPPPTGSGQQKDWRSS
jgi:endonuclease VIII